MDALPQFGAEVTDVIDLVSINGIMSKEKYCDIIQPPHSLDLNIIKLWIPLTETGTKGASESSVCIE